MQYYDRPQTYVLKGEEAIEALETCKNELEREKPEELTEEQAQVMIKLVEGLIQTIESEPSIRKSKQELPQLFNMFRKTVSTGLSKLLQDPFPSTSPSQTISPLNHHLAPVNRQKLQ